MHPLALHELAQAKNSEYLRQAAQERLARQARPADEHGIVAPRFKVVAHAASVAALTILVAGGLA